MNRTLQLSIFSFCNKKVRILKFLTNIGNMNVLLFCAHTARMVSPLRNLESDMNVI
jgi:hypothetical protein